MPVRVDVQPAGEVWLITVRLLPSTTLEAAWQTCLHPVQSSLNTVRASGVLLLLGVGTLVCYRLYTRCVDGDSGADAAGGRQGGAGDWRQTLEDWLGSWRTGGQQLVSEEGSDLDPNHRVEVHYFGPSDYLGPSQPSPPRASRTAEPLHHPDDTPPAAARRRRRHQLQRRSCRSTVEDSPESLSPLCVSHSPSPSSNDSLQYQADHSASLSPDEQDGASDCDCSASTVMGNRASSSSGADRSYEPVVYHRDSGGVVFNRLRSDVLLEEHPLPDPALTTTSSGGGSPSITVAPMSADVEGTRRRVILPRTPVNDSGGERRARQLRRQLSGAAQRGGSVDLSVWELSRLCSGTDTSLDSESDAMELSWAGALGASTVDMLDCLQQQLDVLKNDVTSMDSELVTLHFPQHTAGGRPRLSQLGRSQSEYRVAAPAAGTPDRGTAPPPPPSQSDSGTDAVLEWDSPVHGWGAVPDARPCPPARRLTPASASMSRSQSLQNSSCMSTAPGGGGSEDMPSLEWDNTGIQQYPELWDEHGADRRLEEDGDVLELDLEAELGSRCSRDSGTTTSATAASTDDGAQGRCSSTPNTSNGSSRQPSLTLMLSRDSSPGVGSDFILDSSGYEGMDSSGLASRTPLSPVVEAAVEPAGTVSPADSVLSGCAGGADDPVCVRPRRGRRGERDSAYWDDGLDTLAVRAALQCVGEPMDLLQYAAQEWKGTTERALTIQAGYAEMSDQLGLSRIQQIRGDNYCAVRAAIYQLLAEAVVAPDADRCRRLLDDLDWLRLWSFGSRLAFSSAVDGVQECLRSLSTLVGEAGCSGAAGEDSTLRVLWNTDPDRDVRVMEAVKLHMLACAVQLHRDISVGHEVPVFGGLLFARDTCTDPRELMLNHLNHVGDSGGLEQIEMCLLGEALGVTLRVIRPSAHGREDFISYYPDHQLVNRPQLTLVADDDRHYNVVS